MKKIFTFLFLMFCISSLFSQVLTLSINVPSDSIMMSLIKKLFGEIGDLSGVTFEIESIPFERSEQRLLSGHIDGDIGRAVFVYEDDDRIIYTNYPVLITHYMIFTKLSSINPGNPDTFKHLRLVAARGSRAVEKWIEEFNITDFVYVNDSETAFLMIDYGRADYFIGPEIFASTLTSNSDLTDIKILNQPVFDLPLYLVLNSNHKDLEPAITAAIKELAESGRTAEIFNL